MPLNLKNNMGNKSHRMDRKAYQKEFKGAFQNIVNNKTSKEQLANFDNLKHSRERQQRING